MATRIDFLNNNRALYQPNHDRVLVDVPPSSCWPSTAIGMCLTGGFALAMAVEPAVLAPVVSQPGLPAPVTARKRAALGLDTADLAQVKARTRRGLCVLGLRFSADRGCPAERFQRLRRELGDGS